MKPRWITNKFGVIVLCRDYPNCNCEGHYEWVPKKEILVGTKENICECGHGWFHHEVFSNGDKEAQFCLLCGKDKCKKFKQK